MVIGDTKIGTETVDLFVYKTLMQQE